MQQCNIGDQIKVIQGFIKDYHGILELNTWADIQVIKSSNKVQARVD